MTDLRRCKCPKCGKKMLSYDRDYPAKSAVICRHCDAWFTRKELEQAQEEKKP